jgi:hypothetical protein
MPQAVIKKKIPPYPINSEVSKLSDSSVFVAQIVKLTEEGFLLKRIDKSSFKPNESLAVSFELPVLKSKIRTRATVIKLYQYVETVSQNHQLIGAKATAVQKPVAGLMVECHFSDIDLNHKDAIHKFLVMIKQVPA